MAQLSLLEILVVILVSVIASAGALLVAAPSVWPFRKRFGPAAPEPARPESAQHTSANQTAPDLLKLSDVIEYLPDGLLFFDTRSQLVLHNSAIGDLTRIPANFWESQPTLGSVLDRLHDRRVFPEPRDYKAWRAQMLNRLAPGFRGIHTEEWPQPDGRTFQVSAISYGPRGISLQIKDVTPNTNLNRHFQAELKLAHDVLNQQANAIAVLDRAGALALTNDAYHRMWGGSTDSVPLMPTSGNVIESWKRASEKSRFWGRLKAMIRGQVSSKPLRQTLRFHGYNNVEISAAPIGGGYVLVTFAPPRKSGLRLVATGIT